MDTTRLDNGDKNSTSDASGDTSTGTDTDSQQGNLRFSTDSSSSNVEASNSSEQGRGSSSVEEGPESLLQKKWEEMFNRLLKYKQTRGDCLVPNRYPEDPQLGNWVSTQRRQYKALKEGASDSTPMTKARAEKLESIGFHWSTKDPRHVPWMTRYQELVDFKEKYGHSQVPIGWEENIQLSNWVSTQRQEYKLLQRGRSSRLTDDRIELLKKVDFVWEAQRGGPRRIRKATVQVPSKASPVEGVGPRAAKRAAFGTSSAPQPHPLHAHDQGFPEGPDQGFPTRGSHAVANNSNLNTIILAAANQLLQNALQGGPQLPLQLLQLSMQQGTFQAQAPLPPNEILPMATAQYTQWLAALQILANLAQQQNNVAAPVAPPVEQAPAQQQGLFDNQPGTIAATQGRPNGGPSSSPKTVSQSESDQRDSDQKISDTGDSDESPNSS